jgi:chromosome partitioning protein
MIISFLQEKGGAGKTTIAINVAVAIKNMGFSVLLVDSDPQGSARDWHTENDGSILDVIGLDRPTIDKDIKRFKREYDYIFVDGAPHLSVMATKTILCSDAILIPVQPSPYDVWASQSLVELIKQRQEITDGKPRAAFIVSRQITGTNIGKEVKSVLESYELPVLTYGTFQRVIYPESASRGEIVNCEPALSEIINLATEIREFVNYGA